MTKRFLYIFPHPDDESFGPARAIAAQERSGHEVFLLTLTRGGATKERHKLGLTVEQMGQVRLGEMKEMAGVLSLTGMTVTDLPDGGLKELDPREIDNVVRNHIIKIKPDIIVTYPVHGISGFHDHLVTHAVVKRAYLELKDEGAGYLERLVFFTLNKSEALGAQSSHSLSYSSEDEIDCQYEVEQQDLEKAQLALDCYKTYQEVIMKSGVRNMGPVVSFEIFGENHNPPLDDLTEGL